MRKFSAGAGFELLAFALGKIFDPPQQFLAALVVVGIVLMAYGLWTDIRNATGLIARLRIRFELQPERGSGATSPAVAPPTLVFQRVSRGVLRGTSRSGYCWYAAFRNDLGRALREPNVRLTYYDGDGDVRLVVPSAVLDGGDVRSGAEMQILLVCRESGTANRWATDAHNETDWIPEIAGRVVVEITADGFFHQTEEFWIGYVPTPTTPDREPERTTPSADK